MLQGFLIGREKGGMEYRVNLPLRRDVKVEGCVGENLFHLEQASSFYLEVLWSVHVEIGCFKPDFISHFPGDELGGYLFLHFLLSHFVGSLSIVSGSRQVRKSTFQIG